MAAFKHITASPSKAGQMGPNCLVSPKPYPLIGAAYRGADTPKD